MLIALAVLAMTAVLSSCSGVDSYRGEKIAAIEAAIKVMPGVERVEVKNSDQDVFELKFRLIVTMPQASEQQIADVAVRLNGARKEHVVEGDHSTTVHIGDRSAVGYYGTRLEPALAVADARRLRAIQSALSTGTIGAGRTPDRDWLLRVEITSEEPAGHAVEAARTGLGDEPAELTIPAAGGTGPNWAIMFPYTAVQEQTVREKTDRLPPNVVFEIAVEGGALSKIWLVLPNTATTEIDLRSVITEIHPTTNHPLALAWTDKTGVREKDAVAVYSEFHGLVIVGGCDYNAEGNGGKSPTPEADALEMKLRKEFDTCPR
ncbi:hypothetical protein [Nocardia sp. NPDC050435]|uniref:hypothetical protein n=1 Tax=Nocardia sp. NPDC050435 TaxID=3155040 RepID=UPI0033D3D9FA